MQKIKERYAQPLAEVIGRARKQPCLTKTVDMCAGIEIEGITLSEGRVAWRIQTAGGLTLADGVRGANDQDEGISLDALSEIQAQTWKLLTAGDA